MALGDLHLLQSKVHALDMCSEICPLLLHICLESENFAINCESLFNTAINDAQHLLDGRAVVSFLRFVAFNLFHQSSRVGVLDAFIEGVA